MVEELISPLIVEGGAREIDAAGVAVVTRYDCDVGDSGGVGEREEGKKNGEGE